MIALGAESQDSQLTPVLSNVRIITNGDELSSLSCDLGDFDFFESEEIEQIFLQNFSDAHLSFEAVTHHGGAAVEGSSHLQPQLPCDLTSLLLEDTKRPRDLNLSFPGEASLTPLFDRIAIPSHEYNRLENVTPTFSGGSTPNRQSRPSSPAWSESSGSMSTCSVSSSTGTKNGNLNNPVPRHKRPSHKRAEVKRRDKIKTYLDDLKDQVPSLQGKGKLSESAILSKAAEYIHQLKDGCSKRGCKKAELRQEIQCLTEEIQNFQESLPASGLNEEPGSQHTLDELYQRWLTEQSQHSIRSNIFSSITSKCFDSFKEVVGPAKTHDSLTAQVKQWQEKYLSLPVLRKEILNGLLGLSRKTGFFSLSEDLKMDVKNEGNS